MIDKNTEDWFQEYQDEFNTTPKIGEQLEFDFGEEFNYIKIKISLIKEFRKSLEDKARNSMVAHEILVDFNKLIK